MSSLSLIVPCYNEEENIRKFTEDWYAELSRKLDDFEIIIVNDCSTDSTPQILKELAEKFPRVIVLTNEKNKKYGETIILGIKYATKDYVIWADSDYSHYPEDIWKLWRYRNDYDTIWGIRGVIQRDSRRRSFFTAGNIILIWILFHIFLKDPNCAFKLYKREKLLRILDTVKTHFLITTTKIAIRTRQMKMSIKEVPVAYIKRSKGSGSVKYLSAALSGFKEMLYFRFSGK